MTAGRVRDAWDRHAADWIRWARDPESDHTFWRWNLPALLELVPPPGRLTLDLGCGEGRVARELAGRGHRVVGVEGSPSLAEAARQASPGVEVHVADAAAVPLEDRCADLAVASMSLLNVERMPEAVREVARVLRPGGRLVFSIVHPSNSAKPMGGHPDAGSYFAEYAYEEVRERPGGATMRFHDIHRPLEAYFEALSAAGLLVEELREPRPPGDYVRERPEMARWLQRPCFLHVRAVRLRVHGQG